MLKILKVTKNFAVLGKHKYSIHQLCGDLKPPSDCLRSLLLGVQNPLKLPSNSSSELPSNLFICYEIVMLPHQIMYLLPVCF